jgi:site-specific DNA recombinase
MKKEFQKSQFFAIYTRQSRESGLDMNSCQAQYDICLNHAKKHRPCIYWVAECFDDEGFSGATLDIPALNRLREQIKEKRFTHVFITYLDRLSRSLTDTVMLLEEFQKAGIKLHVVKMPQFNTDAKGNFLSSLLASFAEFERDLIKDRIASSREHLKAYGRRLAGRIPFGYDTDHATKQLIINKKEAVQVQKIFAMACEGRTPSEITAIINKRGWRTKKHIAQSSGKVSGYNRWLPRQIGAMLRNPVYIGKFKDGNFVRHGGHEAIIETVQFEKVQQIIDGRRTKNIYGKRSKRKHEEFLLRGKIICPKCGRKLTTDTANKKQTDGKSRITYRYYRCRSTAGGKPPCKDVRYSAYELERFVCDAMRDAKFWQKLKKAMPDETDTLNRMFTIWSLLDESVRQEFIPDIIEEIRLTEKDQIEISCYSDLLIRFPVSEGLPETD